MAFGPSRATEPTGASSLGIVQIWPEAPHLAGDGREQDGSPLLLLAGFPGLSLAPTDCEPDPAVLSCQAKATSGTASSSSLLHSCIVVWGGGMMLEYLVIVT